MVDSPLTLPEPGEDTARIADVLGGFAMQLPVQQVLGFSPAKVGRIPGSDPLVGYQRTTSMPNRVGFPLWGVWDVPEC